MLATRFSNSFSVPLVQPSTQALLVRIYPQQGIGQPLELDQASVSIGREGCSLCLTDDSVSRQHARIEWSGSAHRVTDLGSTNGTFVNEQRIAQQELRIGDRVRFGNQIFKYLSAQDIESQYHEVVYRIMTTDGLTGTYNKRYLIETLERELACTVRHNETLSLAMLDLDRFKSINDTFGHLAGDAVLVEFARRAKSMVRSGEILARYGGEEFALLLPRTEQPQAIATAERLRQTIAAQPVVFEQHSIPITVSIGLATIAAQPCTAQELIAIADERLYIAKNSGRNRVCYES